MHPSALKQHMLLIAAVSVRLQTMQCLDCLWYLVLRCALLAGGSTAIR